MVTLPVVKFLLLKSAIELMAECQQEFLWESNRISQLNKPTHLDMAKLQSLLQHLDGYRSYATGLITQILIDNHPLNGSLPNLHPAVILSRDSFGKITIEFQQDLRDYLPEDSRPPEAIWLGGTLQPSR